MAFEISWHKDHISIFTGAQATGREIIDAMQVLWLDERFDATLPQVWDFSATQKFEVSLSDLQQINSLTQEQCLLDRTTCLALVAPEPSVYVRLQAVINYTKARLCNSKVFNDIDQALSWMQHGILRF